ncbi:hypothetical protein BG015_004007 [Linnemannia schmuckeri]|uniref:Uncharacterized protein n=1 Tax=Linnemannia schmuckeri TaxID=64567 RepID=A0A9P5S226_9FUNG|nr:hypothetical protein BG015_004007 [Linnemannia schmuckeri]
MSEDVCILDEGSKVPGGAKMHIDVLSFFKKIRWIYTKHAGDKTKAYTIPLAHLKKFGDPLRMVYYVDGVLALEKKETHRAREEKRVKAVKTSKVAIETLNERVSQGKPPTKEMFKNVEKSLHGGFQWVTVLDKTGLSTTKFTALTCVSSNDYNKNIPSLGIATNYKVIKDLPDTDAPSLVQEYLKSPLVICSNQDEIDFAASILMFIRLTQEIAAPAGVISDPPSTAQSEAPLTNSPPPSMSYDVLYQQYKSIKDQHAKAKAQKRINSSSKRIFFSDTKPERQGKHKEFRRHRVIDKPAYRPGVSRQVHRPRYSPKARSEPQQQGPPGAVPAVDSQGQRRQAEKKREREARRLQKKTELLKKPPPKVGEMDKMQLIKAMVWKHSLVSLPVHTIRANSKRAAAATTTDANQLSLSKRQQQHQQQQQQGISTCILDVIEQATKRYAQKFLGAFIETIFKRGSTEEDRAILNTLRPAVESKIRASPEPNQDSQAGSNSAAGTPSENEGLENAEDDVDEDAEPSAMDKPFIAFYQILLGHIYSCKIKSKTVIERQVDQLLARATSLGITLPSLPQCNVSYSTSYLLEPTTKQLYRSIKMMYRNGSAILEKKINSQANGQSGTVLPKIDSTLPTIENYMLLNKASGRSRRIAPLSPLAARYIGFSERQFLPLFWALPTLKAKIQSMMVKDRYFQDPTIVLMQADALDWLARTTSGRLVTTFLSDVGLLPNKHDKGLRKATTVTNVKGKDGKEGLREHLGPLRAGSFDPKEWRDKGYVLRGSIRINGHLQQLLAFKLKELQSVRFRHIPEDKLPNPLVTTIGGTNSYLTEARNIFSTAADVESLLAADPSQVAALSLDLGTSCIVGATVPLPSGQTPATLKRPLDKEGDQKKKKKTKRGKRKPGYHNRQRARQKARKLAKQPQTTQYFDLMVKRKAVSRPPNSFANWLEDRKENTTGAITGRTIQDLESTLPPLKGEGASSCEYDAQVCRKEEFYKVAEGLLKMISGSVGRPRMPHQHVVIAARSLGYLVIGINEYYSSKRYPHCHGFVCATSGWRTLYCKICKRFWQRDVMASDNMNNSIKNHLIHQQQPHYLQSRRQGGSYPWMDVAAGGDSGGNMGEAGGLSAEAMDSSGDGTDGSGGGGAAAASPSMATATNHSKAEVVLISEQ